jgi:hypothetical protein
MNFTIEPGSVRFDICLNWSEADVDAVYAEIGGMFQGNHQVSTSRTPIAGSVEKVLNDVLMNCKAYWESIGVECKEYCSLMMGCASATFETTMEKFSPELVKQVKTDVQRLMVAGVRYYRQKTNINGHRIVSVVTHA